MCFFYIEQGASPSLQAYTPLIVSNQKYSMLYTVTKTSKYKK